MPSADAAGERRLLDWGVRRVKAVPGVSPRRGRGLFAAERIARGEIIERACTVYIDAQQALALDRMLPLGDFYFQHPLAKEEGLMVLGFASLCNHADDPERRCPLRGWRRLRLVRRAARPARHR